MRLVRALKTYECSQGPDTYLIVTGILELMPVRRSACTAGVGFLQHQPRLACTGPLG